MTVLSFLVIIAFQLRFFALRTWHPLRKRKAMASVAGPAARLLSAPVGGGTGSGVLTETCLPNWTYSSGMLWKSFFSRSYVSFSFFCLFLLRLILPSSLWLQLLSNVSQSATIREELYNPMVSEARSWAATLACVRDSSSVFSCNDLVL